MSDWRAFLAEAEDEGIQDVISQHERTGSPLGANSFFDRLEQFSERMYVLKNLGGRRK